MLHNANNLRKRAHSKFQALFSITNCPLKIKRIIKFGTLFVSEIVNVVLKSNST